MIKTGVVKTAETLAPTRQTKGFSKQKIASYVVLVFAAAPTIIPHFNAYVPEDIRSAIMGLSALMVIIFRELQKDL
jgi:hypothetical protein